MLVVEILSSNGCKGAGHGLAYMIDPVRYEIVTVDFLWEIPALQEHMHNNAYCNKIHQRQLDF